MAKLWAAVVLLALVYLGVWSAVKEPAKQGDTFNLSPGEQTNPPSDLARLVEIAKGQTISRAESGAQITQGGVSGALFKGEDLQPASSGDPDAKQGYIIETVARQGNRPIGRYTFHAVAPDRVVFIKQEGI